MSAQTYSYQGPVDGFLVTDYIATAVTTATSTYATMATVPTGFKGHLGSIRLRLNAGATAGAEVFTFRILRADASATTSTVGATVAMSTAAGTSGGFGNSALTYGEAYTLPTGLTAGYTVQYTLGSGDQIQVAQTANGTVGTEYHIDVTALLIP